MTEPQRRGLNWTVIGGVLASVVSLLTAVSMIAGPLRTTLTLPREVERLDSRVTQHETRSLRFETELTELRLEARQEVRLAAEKFKRVDEKLTEQTEILREVNRKLEAGPYGRTTRSN